MSLDPIDRLLATLYAAPTTPELWQDFLDKTAVLIGVNRAALLTHDVANDEHLLLAGNSSWENVAECGRLYKDHYWQHDEWILRGLPKKALGRVGLGTEVWPVAEMQRTTFYNEYLVRHRVHRLACIVNVSSLTTFENLSVYCGPDNDCFDNSQLALLNMLVPHLRIALTTRQRLRKLESQARDLENVLDQLETGLMLVDAQGSPVFVNRQARRIFDQRDGLHLCRSRLAAQNPEENGRLRGIIAKAISGGRSKSLEHGGATLVSRASRRPLQILAAPFIPGGLPAAKGAVAIIFISDPDLKPALRSDLLRELYGLTEAEARLALLLSDGQSLTEAAASIRVGRETVRSQIKSIFLKTETRRQSELIGLLARLPGRNI